MVLTRRDNPIDRRHRRTWQLISVLAVAASLVLAGCSSSGSGASSGSSANSGGAASQPATATSSSAAAADDSDVVTQAKATVKQLTDPTSSLFNYSSVIPTQPVAVKKGSKFAIIGAALASPVVKQYCDTVAAAAKLAGLESTEFDGKFDVATEAGLVQQAVQQKFAAIVLVGVDPATVASPIASAKAAGIPVIQYDGYGDTNNGVTDIGIDPIEAGRAVAQWIIADSNGTAKVLAVTFKGGATGGKTSNTEVAQESLISTLQKCSGCTVKTKDMTIADVVAPGSPEYVAALRSYPKGAINYVASGCDTCMINFGMLDTQLGRSEIKVTGGFAASQAATAEIKNGTDNAVVAPINPSQLIGLLSVDAALRRIAGQQVKTLVIPAPLADKGNVSDFPDASFTPAKDYTAVFAKLWTS
jgi:ribose transport system substrate-binding protein